MFDLENKESVKKAIRVDHDFDDELIMDMYLPSSINQVKSAVSQREEDDKFFEDNALFNLAVMNTLAHHYDNRAVTSEIKKEEVPYSSVALIQSLRADLQAWREKEGVVVEYQ